MNNFIPLARSNAIYVPRESPVAYEDKIRQLAEQIYLERCQYKIPGDATSDWEQARIKLSGLESK